MYALFIAACLLADASIEPVVKIEETIKVETKIESEEPKEEESENPSPVATSPNIQVLSKPEVVFLTQYEVLQPVRVALTPHLSGKIQHENWNLFTKNNDLTSYFQWEPGILYAAATVPSKKDVVLSFDMHGKGWLHGKDNFEVRVSWTGQGPKMKVRRLNAEHQNGPQWFEDPLLNQSIQFFGSAKEDSWDMEMRILDAVLPEIKEGKQLGVRFDIIDPDQETPVPYLPRLIRPVKLQLDAALDLPAGMQWDASYKLRTVTFNHTLPIKFTFYRPDTASIKRIDLRTEGFEPNNMTFLGRPFPAYERTGKAIVETDVYIPENTALGYRVLRGKLLHADQKETMVESSFRVSEVVRFDFDLPKDLRSRNEPQTIRTHVIIRSQTPNKVNGRFSLEVPEGWTINSGIGYDFWINHSYGSQRMKVEFVVPKESEGLIPITCKANIEGKLIRQTFYLPIKKSMLD